MFSGIISNRGTIISCKRHGGQIRFAIKLQRKEKKLKVGESMSVNGVCLTITLIQGLAFYVDVVHETLRATTLELLQEGDGVNLERSLRFGDLVGGHLVSGHVDGVGRIEKIEKQGNNQLWFFKAPKEVMALLAVKGSIAIDGISLTIQHLTKDLFSIALIPHTLRETTLGNKKCGDEVNLEVDLIARYLQTLLSDRNVTTTSTLSLSKLAKQGF
ncbi:MAG: riboflavin synthase [Candidatus Omnitrophica bacterium]|nr:riboflavin synthase [Candidatus Omnitrophota bacterium]